MLPAFERWDFGWLDGASQAILDARRLAPRPSPLAPGTWHLAGKHWDDALAGYEAEQRPATAALVAANRGLGPDLVIELVHQRAAGGFTDLHSVISQAELEGTASAYKTPAGFDPALLNARESWSVIPAPRPAA